MINKMKKQISILSFGLILAGSSLGFSQENKIQPCNTYEAMEQHFAEDPAAKVRYDAAQAQLHQEYLENVSKRDAPNTANKTTAIEYTVPVVFHILHQGGPENISDADCIAALKQVNDDYSRAGADTASIFAPFKSLYINSDIKFMLARKDPSGNCISGIVRHVDPKTNWSQGTANQSNAAGTAYWPYTWNPTKYLNIYIVANIVPQGTVTGGGIIVGYTYRPNTWAAGNPHDAIVYRYNYLTAGPPNYNARSLTHEIGHWLNLAHTFGNTNNPGVVCGDDGLSDTPITKGNFSSCPASNTNSNVTCAQNITSYYQNVQNIMDYSSCPKNFTKDQTTAIRTALQSANSGRNNITTLSNLSASFTDVNNNGPCAPVAEFLSTSNSYTICLNGSLTMKDYSYNGTITSYQWSSNNGATFASPSSSITAVTFTTLGAVDVTLTVSNGQGSSNKVRTVTVISGAADITGSYDESFEGAGLPINWSTATTPSSSAGWQQANGVALDQSNSYYINGGTTTSNQESILQMPIIDLQNNPGCNFSFAYSYARKSASHADFFRLQMSKDCGGSWSDVVQKNAAAMANETGGILATAWVPSNDDDWAVVHVTDDYALWNNFTNSPSVLIRFVFEEAPAGQGNNFYLDAIHFTTVVGINELTKSIRLNMYPNPTTGETNLTFNLNESALMTMNVVDILGKEVIATTNHQMNAGEQTLSVNKDNKLTKGIYFVNLSMNGAKMSRKLIIN